MIIREMMREEIERVWDDIDRSEVIENIYYLRDGDLVLENERYDMRDWAPGEREQYTPPPMSAEFPVIAQLVNVGEES